MFQLAKLLTGAAASALALTGSAAFAETTYIQAGSVIFDASGEASGPATIIVTDGKIVEIRNGHDLPANRVNFVDLKDKTVLPGLIDLHTHLSGDPSGEYWRAATTPPEWSTLVAAKNARITAKAGFTTVRDLGSRTDQVTQMLRRATATGMIPGPRVVTSARTIAIVGGHGDINGFRREVSDVLATDFTCTGPTECAETVRTASKYGADLIKITATGGVLSQQGRGLEAHFTPEEMRSIVTTADTLGLKVAAHAHGARGVEAASRAGVQTIEHGTFIDAQAARVMKENGTILVPTLMAFQGVSEGLGKGVYTPVVEEKIRATVDVALSLVTRARAEGVEVAFGTDAGVFAHGRNAEEFALMKNQGMTDREALAAATTVAAKVLQMENEIGRIAVGYFADIIAVDGNPLDDVTVLENVDWVMVRGTVVE